MRPSASGKAIGIAIQDVPYSADLIVDFNVSPWSTEAGFELKRPILVGVNSQWC